MKFCVNCGAPMEDNVNICGSCGAAQDKSQSASYANQPYANQGYNNQGYNNQGYNNQGYNNQGYYPPYYPPVPPVQDESSVGFGILGFFFPIVGIILYFVWKSENKPLKAKSAGLGALIRIILNVIFTIIFVFVIPLAFAGAGFYL